MCNFILSNGNQCKYAKYHQWCRHHTPATPIVETTEPTMTEMTENVEFDAMLQAQEPIRLVSFIPSNKDAFDMTKEALRKTKAELDETKDKLEIAISDNYMLQEELSDYHFVKWYNTRYDELLELTGAKNWPALTPHLKLKRFHTRKAIIKYFQGNDNGFLIHAQFDAYREKRNRLAHAILKDLEL